MLTKHGTGRIIHDEAPEEITTTSAQPSPHERDRMLADALAEGQSADEEPAAQHEGE